MLSPKFRLNCVCVYVKYLLQSITLTLIHKYDDSLIWYYYSALHDTNYVLISMLEYFPFFIVISVSYKLCHALLKICVPKNYCFVCLYSDSNMWY